MTPAHLVWTDGPSVSLNDRALILGGGGVRGIYQVGVLLSILEESLDRDWRFIGGNSVGSVNGCFLGRYPMGQILQGVKDLYDVWHGLNRKEDLWKIYFFSYFKALFDNGVADPKPLQELIRRHFDAERMRKSGRKVVISTVDTLTNYKEYDETNMTWKEVYGSAAMPYALPAILTDDAFLTDGGVLKPGPISTAIKMGYRKIDIILNGPVERSKRIPDIPYDECKKIKPMMKFALRLLDLILQQQWEHNMKLAFQYNKEARSGNSDRHEIDFQIYAPKDLLSGDLLLLDLNPELIQDWFKQGLKTKPISLDEFIEKIDQ
jgi:predicted acylesterase/phospholipase RssA